MLERIEIERLGVHIALALSACVTNSAFIITVGRKRRLRNTTNLILLSMAVADLFVGIFVTPLLGIFTKLDILVENAYMCACIHSVLLYFIIVSLHHIVLVAIERYLSFIYPLRYPVIFTYSVLRKSIAACWIVPLAITISPALGWYNHFPPATTFSNLTWTQDSNSSRPMYSRCQVEHITSCSYTFLVSGVVVVVFVLMTYFHLRIFVVACRHVRKHYERTNQSKHVSTWKSFKKETRTFFMVMFVVDYFLISWSPVGALVFMGCVVDPASIPKWMSKVFPLLAMTNSALNPIVYGLAKRDIRKYIFNKLCGEKKKTHVYRLASSGYTRRNKSVSSNSSDKEAQSTEIGATCENHNCGME